MLKVHLISEVEVLRKTNLTKDILSHAIYEESLDEYSVNGEPFFEIQQINKLPELDGDLEAFQVEDRTNFTIDSDGLDLKEGQQIKTWEELIQWIKDLVICQYKITEKDITKPVNQPCPACGSKSIERYYFDSEAWFDKQLKEWNFEDRHLWCKPKPGKIHNWCDECNHQWNSDPLCQENVEPHDDPA